MDLAEILSSLSSDDIEKLKGTAQQLMGSLQKEQNEPVVNNDIISAIDKVGKLINTKDDRYNLIMALKPLLSEPRRQRADQAAKILKLISIIPVLKENGILNDLL